MLRYAITDRTRLGHSEAERTRALLACTTRWALAGIDIIQIRERDLSASDLFALARQMKAAIQAAGAHTRLLINSRVDIALAVELDGVHLTSSPDTLTAENVRQLQPTLTISLSCHTLDDVRRALASRVDLILFGPVFGKDIDGAQVSAPLGVAALAQACALAAPTPVIALGGLTLSSTSDCLAAGAQGIAAIRLFLSDDARSILRG